MEHHYNYFKQPKLQEYSVLRLIKDLGLNGHRFKIKKDNL